jgi:hypothetical protein
VEHVFEKVNAAHLCEDWREVLKWKGRMEEMMEYQPDAVCNDILVVFVDAHERAFRSTGSEDNSLSIVRLEKRRAEVLGKMQRFRDQGEVLCRASDYLRVLGRRQEAEEYFKRARKIAEAHGFFSAECRSCLGLGCLAMEEKRQEEGLELLRNALICVPLCEEEDTVMELNVLQAFTRALFHTHAIDEVEPLVARFLKAAKAESENQGRLHLSELRSLYASARLHEVLCLCPPVLGTPSHCMAFAFRYQHARTKLRALVEPHALARHAGELKRPRGRCALCSTSCAGTRQQCKQCPINANPCCVTPASNSRFSTRGTGRRSSSSWWQPSWQSFRCLCGNQVRWCFVSHLHRFSLPHHH